MELQRRKLARRTGQEEDDEVFALSAYNAGEDIRKERWSCTALLESRTTAER